MKKYLVAALILTIPLYPKFPFLRIPESQVALRLEDILIALTLTFFIPDFIRNLKNLFNDNIASAILIYLGIGLISLLSAVFVTQTVVPKIGFLHWARRVEYMSLFFVGLSAVKNQKRLEFFIKLFPFIILYNFIFGFGQKYLNWPIITTQNYEYAKGIALHYVPGAHIPGTFAGHYDLAAFLILSLPLILAFGLSPKKTLKKFFGVEPLVAKAVMFTIFGLGLWLLVNAASRISIVSYLIGAVTTALVMRKYRYIPVLLFVSIAFIGFSSNLIDRYVRIFRVAIDEVAASEIANPQPTPTPEPIYEDRSTSIRLNVEWPRAIRALKKNPLLGTGYSSITLATDNDYLRALGETGILGFGAIGFVFANIIYLLLKNFPFRRRSASDVYALAILASIPGLFLLMFFIDILEASKFATIFWLMMGMLSATTYEDYQKTIR